MSAVPRRSKTWQKPLLFPSSHSTAIRQGLRFKTLPFQNHILQFGDPPLTFWAACLRMNGSMSGFPPYRVIQKILPKQGPKLTGLSLLMLGLKLNLKNSDSGAFAMWYKLATTQETLLQPWS